MVLRCEAAKTARHAAAWAAACLAVLVAVLGGRALTAEPAAAAPPSLSFSSGPVTVPELRAEARRVRAEIERLDHRVAVAVERYDQAASALDELTIELMDIRSELALVETKLDLARDLLASRTRAMYKGGELGLLDIVFGAADLSEMQRQLEFYRLIADADGDAVAVIEGLAHQAAELEVRFEERRQAAQATEQRLEEERAMVEDELARREAVLRDLDGRIKKILEREARRAAAEARRLAAKAGVDLDSLKGTPVQLSLVREALRWVGKPYVWGGADPQVGFDCSGLAMYVYAKHGVKMPHGATLQARMGRPVPLSAVQPGDLVFFGTPAFYHHVGMYIGRGLFVEARGRDYGVVVSTLEGRGCSLACRYSPRLP
ncbi:MAG: NlpC/P60 family protein [Thermoleophilia bacterium]|jgi:cell wall-associated NlpC family hydrolase|nr:NlpC/P60 family protein [Thermoleophilia bacterium]